MGARGPPGARAVRLLRARARPGVAPLPRPGRPGLRPEPRSRGGPRRPPRGRVPLSLSRVGTLGDALRPAVVAGLLAGLLAAVFHQVLTEPVIDRAIAAEEAR